jgi:organic anion transporter 4A
MAAFLPKYFESQFMLSPGDAAMLVGLLVVPAGAGGTLLGGYLGKRLKLDRAGSIKMYIVCQCVILPLYLGFLLYCPNTDIDGVVRDGESSGNFSLYNGCNADCACSRADYNPVCSMSDDVTYFNPCYAGCTGGMVNEVSYSGCGCLAANATSAVFGEGEVVRGVCESAKCNYVYFAAFVFLQVFFTFAATMPGLVASLRWEETYY